jgi:hypothetical protein
MPNETLETLDVTGRVFWNGPVQGRTEVFDELLGSSSSYRRQLTALVVHYAERGCIWSQGSCPYKRIDIRNINGTWVNTDFPLIILPAA